jgi:hypothetical protein
VSQAITVQDVTAPSISAAGPDMTIDCPGVPSFTEPRATDECSSASIVLVSDITEGDACSYTQTKTWKAVDICGNESGTVSQAITVHDITAPSISGEGADAFLEDCHADVVFTAPIASDLCDPSPSVNVVSTSTVQMQMVLSLTQEYGAQVTVVITFLLLLINR